MESLFSPFKLKSLQTRTRIVMAPMTRAKSPGGIPNEAVAAYYSRRAEADVGLIISEGTGIARAAALNQRDVPRFHGTSELLGWKKVIDAVHAAGGAMAPQLWHVGAFERHDPTWSPAGSLEGPSGLQAPQRPVGQAMSDSDIADTIASYASAAASAKALGFDALEIHAAHGYLIDQFFWSNVNRRTDGYGGATIAARARFAAEIVRAVRKAVGEDFALSLRISQFKIQDLEAKNATTVAELQSWVAPLVEAGVDLFHCSQRRFWEPEFDGSDLNLAGWVKRLTGKPTITVGSIGLWDDETASASSRRASLDNLVRRFERGDFDLVAVGRALLQDPHWTVKVRAGKLDGLMRFSRSALATLS